MGQQVSDCDARFSGTLEVRQKAADRIVKMDCVFGDKEENCECCCQWLGQGGQIKERLDIQLDAVRFQSPKPARMTVENSACLLDYHCSAREDSVLNGVCEFYIN